MGSKKRSARQRQREAFEADLFAEDLGDAFDRARQRSGELAAHREDARRERACERKTRYASRMDAEEALERCRAHGRRDLSYYRCPYCHGWHLTSHPRS